MSETKPIIEWRFPDDDAEERTIHTSGALPSRGDVVKVYEPAPADRKRTRPAEANHYVVDRIEWSIFDKRDHATAMGSRLTVFAIVFLRVA